MDYGHFVDIEDYDFNTTYQVVKYEEPSYYKPLVDSSFNYITTYIASYMQMMFSFVFEEDI
jgi:hypothetical protein